MDSLKYRWKTRFVGEVDRILTVMSLCFIVLKILGAISSSALLIIRLQGEGEQSIMKNPLSHFADFEFDLDLTGDTIIEDEDGVVVQQFHPVLIWVFVGTIWLVLLSSLVAGIFGFVAATKLITATAMGTDPILAKRNACFWRICAIVLTVLTGLNLLSGGLSRIITGILLVTRVITICVVTEFIKELEHRIATSLVPVELVEPQILHSIVVEANENPSHPVTSKTVKQGPKCPHVQLANNAAAAYADVYGSSPD